MAVKSNDIKRCRWCGQYIARGYMCDSCKRLSAYYSRRVPRRFHSTPTGELIKFRNACMDMVNFREHGGVEIPADVDYQLERATRYLNEKETSNC